MFERFKDLDKDEFMKEVAKAHAEANDRIMNVFKKEGMLTDAVAVASLKNLTPIGHTIEHLVEMCDEFVGTDSPKEDAADHFMFACAVLEGLYRGYRVYGGTALGFMTLIRALDATGMDGSFAKMPKMGEWMSDELYQAWMKSCQIGEMDES